LSSISAWSLSCEGVSDKIGYVELGYTDSKSALKSAELVEILIATAEYHLVYRDATAIAESDGQI